MPPHRNVPPVILPERLDWYHLDLLENSTGACVTWPLGHLVSAYRSRLVYAVRGLIAEDHLFDHFTLPDGPNGRGPAANTASQVALQQRLQGVYKYP